MLFGEYELSPSLIGLSLLPSPHPEAFQRLLVRTSIRCYPDFILDKGRSLGFASASGLLRPLVGVWFQELFHSPTRGAFHLSLTVLVHYRSLASI